MKIIRQIEFTGKNLNDIFNLKCVQSIRKSTYDLEPIVKLWESYMQSRDYNEALIGDTLVEYDDGKWDIIPPYKIT
jgi:hypothetical protein